MNQKTNLERAAIDAFRRGIGWNEYYSEHTDAIRQAAPYSARAYRRLYLRLLSIVTSGDDCGTMSISEDDVAPWVADDSTPSDSVTHARCLWPMTQEVPR